jgi:hypothetical protein
MRTFAFLLEGGVPRERAQKLLAPLELTGRGLDPADSAEKGRLVWWHENFVAGLDSTGFCAFSAAGVLADGVMELGELAARLLGEGAGAEPADELLARGASLCLLARELMGDLVTPPAAALAGPWDEYRALRGLNASGGVLSEVAAKIGSHELLRWELARASEEESERESVQSGGEGVVTLSGSGGIKRALGGSVELSLVFPVTLNQALVALSEQHPGVKELIFVKDAAIVTAWRAGERVDLDGALEDGDQLDLILAVGGG